VRIVYFGTSPFAIPTLRALVAHGYCVPTVVTQPDRPAGRGGRLTPPAVKLVAEELRLPVLQPDSCRSAEFLEELRAYAPDLSVVAAYGQFLPDPLRTLPPLGTVNLHGSLLPKYRGAAPIQRAVWNGEEQTGVCLMWMAREMDAGDVIDCAATAIAPDDTAGTLGARLADMAVDLLLHWLPAIEHGTAPHLPQEPAEVTFAPIIRKEEREIDWMQSAVQIDRQIRALSPQPVATTAFRGFPVKILQATVVTANGGGEPGTVIEARPKVGPIVATGKGAVAIQILQPAGKRPMSGAEFLQGYHVQNGERFSVI